MITCFCVLLFTLRHQNPFIIRFFVTMKKFTLTFLMKNDFGTSHNAPKTTAITLWKTIIIKRNQKCLALPLLSLCARYYWGHNFTYGDFFRRNPKGRYFLCFRVSCPLTKLLISFITCRKIVRILPYLEESYKIFCRLQKCAAPNRTHKQHITATGYLVFCFRSKVLYVREANEQTSEKDNNFHFSSYSVLNMVLLWLIINVCPVIKDLTLQHESLK